MGVSDKKFKPPKKAQDVLPPPKRIQQNSRIVCGVAQTLPLVNQSDGRRHSNQPANRHRPSEDLWSVGSVARGKADPSPVVAEMRYRRSAHPPNRTTTTTPPGTRTDLGNLARGQHVSPRLLVQRTSKQPRVSGTTRRRTTKKTPRGEDFGGTRSLLSNVFLQLHVKYELFEAINVYQ